MDKQSFDFNKFKEDVHKCAVDHGWWDKERPALEAIALMHSELSEALEEYRNGRSMIWEKDVLNKETGVYHKKPEGIATELIDCVIRILDFMGRHDLNFFPEQPRERDDDEELPVFIANLHHDLSELIDVDYIVHPDDTYTDDIEDIAEDEEEAGSLFSQIILDIFGWLEAQGVNPYKIIVMKHEYNKTRPYRHGGKVC